MTTRALPKPVTAHDFAARRSRVLAAASEVGLSGLLVTPGPDLVWLLTGYQPTAITERLTLLVLTTDREPTLVVPALERPDAEAATASPAGSGFGSRTSSP